MLLNCVSTLFVSQWFYWGVQYTRSWTSAPQKMWALLQLQHNNRRHSSLCLPDFHFVASFATHFVFAFGLSAVHRIVCMCAIEFVSHISSALYPFACSISDHLQNVILSHFWNAFHFTLGTIECKQFRCDEISLKISPSLAKVSAPFRSYIWLFIRKLIANHNLQHRQQERNVLMQTGWQTNTNER